MASIPTSAEKRLDTQWELPTTLRLVIIAVVLLLAAYLAQNPSVTYLSVPVVMLIAAVLYRVPALGLAGIVIAALLIPWQLNTRTQTGLHLAFIGVPILGVIWLIKRIYARKGLPYIPPAVFFPLLGMVTTLGLSWLAGFLPWSPFASQAAPLRAQLGAIAIFVFSVGAFMLTASLIEDLRWLKLLVAVFVGIGGVYMVGRAFEIDAILRLVIREATGSLFWVWLVALTGGQLLFNQSLTTRWRLPIAAILFVALYVAVIPDETRDWASGWVPSLMVIVCLIWLRWPRRTVVFGLMAGVALLVNFRFVSDFLLSGDNAYSLLTRQIAFDILVQVILANPWLGVGPANYYYYTRFYPILGYYVRFNSHNQYIDIVAQAGLIGMFFFLWIGVAVAVIGWRLRKNLALDGYSAGYVHACLAGLVGTFIAGWLGDWVIPFVYNGGVAGFRSSLFAWLFLGGMIAIARIASAKQPQTG